jgi:flagellar biosynthesis component FlhA
MDDLTPSTSSNSIGYGLIALVDQREGELLGASVRRQLAQELGVICRPCHS